MLGSVIYMHIGDQLAAKTILGKHAFEHVYEQRMNSGFDVLVVRFTHEHFRSQLFLAAGISGESIEYMICHFFTGQNNLIGIDDDHIVATLHIGRIAGFVFTHENFGHLGTKTSEMLVGSIDENPFMVDALGIWRESLVA